MVSDLLQELSDLDFSPWSDVLGMSSGSVLREHRLSSAAGRADIVVLDGSENAVAVVEVKIGHSFSRDQRDRYSLWADERNCHKLLLTIEPRNYHFDGWDSQSLAAMFGRWLSSTSLEARLLAARVVAIFDSWEKSLQNALLPGSDDAALGLSSLSDPALKRVLTRTLKSQLEKEGVEAYAGVSSGGGNALLQLYRDVPDEVGSMFFIAEARFEPVTRIRFGVETTDDDIEGRQRIFEIATTLDSSLRVDSLKAHLRSIGEGWIADRLTATSRPGSGRPRAAGDWSTAVATGKVPSGTNPGFHRDRATRLEAMANLDGERATMEDVRSLLTKTLDAMAADWSNASRRT